MKTLLTLLFCSFLFIAKAQFPKLISYQGIARNATGGVLSNQAIGVQFQIRQGSATGSVVFTESYSTSTNPFGLFNLQIGSANAASFGLIDWAQGPYFIEVFIDPTGGTSYVSVGSTMLVSVPYALYAEKAGNATPIPTITVNSPNSITNPSTGVYDINVQAQTLSVNNNSLSISNGNTVTLPTGPTYTAGTGIDLTGNIITNTAPAVTPTLSVIGNNISINPGNTQALPVYSLTQSGSNIDLTQDGISVATISLTASTSTSLTAGNANVSLTQAGNNYTITTVTPSLTVVNGTLTGAYPSQTLTIPAGVSYVGDGTNISVAGNMISLMNTSVPPGLYGGVPYNVPTFSVDVYGRLVSAGQFTPNINGDVNGTIAASSVVALLGRPLGGSAPTTNQVLTWDGTNWVPAAVPVQSLSLVGNVLRSGPATNTVAIPSSSTTLVQGANNNITITNSGTTYTVSAPSYVLGTSSNSITLTNGVNSSSVAVPTQSLALVGTTLTSGPATNSVNLSTLPSNWTVSSGFIYPTTLTNSVGIGTSGPLTDKMEINHSSTPSNTHLHLKQTSADAFSRIKFSNAVAPTKYWINSVTSNATDANSGYNLFYFNGSVGRTMFTAAGDGRVSVNPFATHSATLDVVGKIELDSTLSFGGYNSAPPVSNPSEGKIYYDRTAQKFKVSENGSVWNNLLNPSPWTYNPGVLFPANNAINDKVAIGSAFANSMLDVQAQAGNTVTANPIVNIQNFNSALNASGVLRVSKTTGTAAVISAINSYSTGEGLNLTMTNANNADAGIHVTQQGTGLAGYFEINNPSSGSAALAISSDASGPALQSIQVGAGEAGNFFINNSASGSVGVRVRHNGVSDGVFSEHWGSSGRAGVFTVGNSTNTSPGIFVQSGGLGHGGFFEVFNPSNNSNAVAAVSYGNGATVYGNNQGNGNAGKFEIPGAGGATNPAAALMAITFGTGHGLEASANGGGSAINATNSSSVNAAVYANNAGGGKAVYAINNSGTDAAGYFYNQGSYDGVGAYSNAGRAIYAQTGSSASGFSGIEGIHYGSGIGLLITKPSGSSGNVARFNNVETSNGADAVWITNSGGGHSLLASKPAGATSGSAARFENLSTGNSADAIFVVNNGVGAAVHAVSGPTVTGGSNAALLVENGHIATTSTGAVTLGPGGTNIGGTTITRTLGAGFNSNDVSGVVDINFAPSVSISNGQYVEVRITFQKPYKVKPKVMAICQTNNLNCYISGTSLTDCQIVVQNNGAVTTALAKVTLNYFIIE